VHPGIIASGLSRRHLFGTVPRSPVVERASV